MHVRGYPPATPITRQVIHCAQDRLRVNVTFYKAVIQAQGARSNVSY